MVVILVVFVDDDDISIVDCGLECVEGMLYDGVYLMMGTVLDDSLLLVVGVYEYVPAYLPKTHIILPTILLQLCKSLQLSKCFLFSVWFVFIVLVIIILFIAFIRVCVLVGCYNYYAG